jgi:hypothetical protein
MQAVALYDALLARVPLIADEDARGEILKWVGRSDSIGSPSERYGKVSEAVTSGAVMDDALAQRLRQLHEINAEFTARVENAEKAYGTLSAAAAAGSMPEAGLGGLCLSGGIALLGLVVLPLILD